MKKYRKLLNLCFIVAIIMSLSMTLMTLGLQNEVSLQDHTKNSEHVKRLKSSASVSELWNYTTGDQVYSSPALGDVDNDSKLEVVRSADDKIYALNGEDGIQILMNFSSVYILFIIIASLFAVKNLYDLVDYKVNQPYYNNISTDQKIARYKQIRREYPKLKKASPKLIECPKCKYSCRPEWRKCPICKTKL